MAAIDDLLKRIMDENKRSFSIEDVLDRDPDMFQSLYVSPLRKLRDGGVIERLAEVRINSDGESYIGRVDIIGGINFED